LIFYNELRLYLNENIFAMISDGFGVFVVVKRFSKNSAS